MVIQEQLKHLKEVVIDLLIGKQFQELKIKELEESNSQRWKWYQEKEAEVEILKAKLEEKFTLEKGKYIQLNGAEIQSGSNRQKYAELLIEQLPKKHEGRNTWLLNYGTGQEAKERRSSRNIKFISETQSAETTKS